MFLCFFFFFKQKTAYEMRISDWSSDVCSSDLLAHVHTDVERVEAGHHGLLTEHRLRIHHDRAQLLGGPALAGAVQRGSDPAVEKLLAQVGVGMAGKTVAELAIGEDLAALGTEVVDPVVMAVVADMGRVEREIGRAKV